MLWAEIFLVTQPSNSAGRMQSLLHKAPQMSNSAGRMQSPPRTSHGTARNIPQFSAVLLHSSSPVRHHVPPTFTVQAEDESDSTENERAL